MWAVVVDAGIHAAVRSDVPKLSRSQRHQHAHRWLIPGPAAPVGLVVIVADDPAGGRRFDCDASNENQPPRIPGAPNRSTGRLMSDTANSAGMPTAHTVHGL